MKRRQLIARFDEYVSAAIRPQASPNEPVAQLYGTDEFKLDRARNRVKLRRSDAAPFWIGVEGLPSSVHEPDWLAAVPNAQGDWYIVLGGGNPFTPPFREGLPVKDGHLLAVPASLSDRLRR